MLGVCYTVVVCVFILQDVKWLKMLREPLLLAGFKYKWWFSAELAQRFLFILVATCSPGSIVGLHVQYYLV